MTTDDSEEDGLFDSNSDYEIQEIRYSDGDIVYQLECRDKDGKPLISIITPDLPEYESIRREYGQRSR